MTDRMTALANLRACPFCGSEQVSLSEGETGDGQPWPYVECEDCAATATPDNWNRRATLSPAELGGVDYRKIAHEIYCHVGQCCGDPMCFFSADECTQARWVEAVETVITHHLSTPRADEAAVDDAMVERALDRLMDFGVLKRDTDYETDSEAVRAALTAALSPPSPGAAK